MRVDEVERGEPSVFELRLADPIAPDELSPGTEVTLLRMAGTPVLVVGRRSAAVEGRSASDDAELARACDEANDTLTWIVRHDPGTSMLTLERRTFSTAPDGPTFGEPTAVSVVDEEVLEILHRRSQLPRNDRHQLLRWLEGQVLLPRPPERTHGDDAEAEADQTREEDLRRFVFVGGNSGGMRLVGRDLSVDLEERDGGLAVRRVLNATAGMGDPVRLGRGVLRFVDQTDHGLFNENLAHELHQLEGVQEYLRLWQRYRELAVERVDHEAAELGSGRYATRRQVGPDWRFEFHNDAGRAFARRVHRADPGLTLEIASDGHPATLQSSDTGSGLAGNVRSVDPEGHYIDVRFDNARVDLPDTAFLRKSLFSDRVQLRRQELAQRQISSMRCGIPWLGFLLEGVNRSPAQVRRRIRVDRNAVRKFLPAPTEAQLEAIDVALNTPDVALIQGPPGTGKTQVIAAVQALLAKEAGDDGNGPAVLLTSAQHDAVEHTASRSTVHGLPALKIGKRRNSGIDDGARNSPVPAIEVWKRGVSTAIAQDVPEAVALLRAVDNLRLIAARLSTEPLDQGAVVDRLVEACNAIQAFDAPTFGARLDVALSKERRTLADAAAPSTPDPARLASDELRSLPTNPEEWSLDHLRTAMKAARRLDSRPEGLDLTSLHAAAQQLPPAAPSEAQLQAVQHLADELDGRRENDPAETWIPREDLARLVLDAASELLTRPPKGITAADVVAAQFARDIELDHVGTTAMIAEYTSVWAATNQHAGSNALTEHGLGRDDVITSVIIDEAARANPLDLFIPMAKAWRRIVLVGDHMQLPHMLEPDVQRDLATELGEEQIEALSRSLFERLFVQFQQIELETGIKRVVTLDRQFRMHPVLGTFVSEQFYGSPERISSGADPNVLTHQVTAFEGRVAAWVDVPRSVGAESGGTSKQRVAEASEVAAIVQQVVTDEPNLSVGVITFYKAQEQLIRGHLDRLGIDRSVLLPDGSERLRVGTVDSFQGMEFDVVVLSTVRSNKLPADTPREQRRKWGFLALPNRMCVAMSRQKRLLVVVGDRAMFPQGSEAIQPLAAFAALADSEAIRVA